MTLLAFDILALKHYDALNTLDYFDLEIITLLIY